MLTSTNEVTEYGTELQPRSSVRTGSHPAAAVPRQPRPELLPVPAVRPPALRAGGLSAGDRPPAAAGAVSPVPRRSRHRHRPASLLQQPQRTGATAGGVGLCPAPA